MNISDSGEFGRRLMTLAELFDLKLSPQRAALYFEALRDLSFDLVSGAMNHAAKSCTFFPKPAELRTFACGDGEDRTENAWMLMLEAVRRAGAYASVTVDDAALGESITAVFGSWPGVCHADLTSEMWASKRKEFGRVYRVMCQRNLDGSRYLPGISEQTNAGRREWSKFVPVTRIGANGLRALTAGEADAWRGQIAAESHEFTQISTLAQSLPRQLGETA